MERPQINIRVNQQILERLKQASERISQPKSDIVRSAVLKEIRAIEQGDYDQLDPVGYPSFQKPEPLAA